MKSNPFIPGDDVFWTEMIHGIHTIVYYSSSSYTRTIIGLGSEGPWPDPSVFRKPDYMDTAFDLIINTKCEYGLSL